MTSIHYSDRVNGKPDLTHPLIPPHTEPKVEPLDLAAMVRDAVAAEFAKQEARAATLHAANAELTDLMNRHGVTLRVGPAGTVQIVPRG